MPEIRETVRRVKVESRAVLASDLESYWMGTISQPFDSPIDTFPGAG